MNILGVDYGKKRIGLAWSNSDLDVVLAFGVAGNIEELKNIIKTEKVDKVIFGLPCEMDGGENENTSQIRGIASDIKNEFQNLEIDFVDEKFTTAEAKKVPGDISIDEKSAILILEDYLKK